MNMIKALKIVLGGFLACTLTVGAYAESMVFSSTAQQTTLLELYTSEGCSSCPPADQWLSQFKDNPLLWKHIVPVAFHVDYWNYLGWRDRFSNPDFSRRQYLYKEHGNVKTVYTPGITINGKEWRGWFGNKALPHASNKDAGTLKAVLNGKNASVEFEPIQHPRRPLTLNIALLGFDLANDISAGENSGRTLTHDFVVLNMRKYLQQPEDDRYQWSVDGILSDISDDATGIALWVTETDDPTPIQSTGGWLK